MDNYKEQLNLRNKILKERYEERLINESSTSVIPQQVQSEPQQVQSEPQQVQSEPQQVQPEPQRVQLEPQTIYDQLEQCRSQHAAKAAAEAAEKAAALEERQRRIEERRLLKLQREEEERREKAAALERARLEYAQQSLDRRRQQTWNNSAGLLPNGQRPPIGRNNHGERNFAVASHNPRQKRPTFTGFGKATGNIN